MVGPVMCIRTELKVFEGSEGNEGKGGENWKAIFLCRDETLEAYYYQELYLIDVLMDEWIAVACRK